MLKVFSVRVLHSRIAPRKLRFAFPIHSVALWYWVSFLFAYGKCYENWFLLCYNSQETERIPSECARITNGFCLVVFTKWTKKMDKSEQTQTQTQTHRIKITLFAFRITLSWNFYLLDFGIIRTIERWNLLTSMWNNNANRWTLNIKHIRIFMAFRMLTV